MFVDENSDWEIQSFLCLADNIDAKCPLIRDVSFLEDFQRDFDQNFFQR